MFGDELGVQSINRACKPVPALDVIRLWVDRLDSGQLLR